MMYNSYYYVIHTFMIKKNIPILLELSNSDINEHVSNPYNNQNDSDDEIVITPNTSQQINVILNNIKDTQINTYANDREDSLTAFIIFIIVIGIEIYWYSLWLLSSESSTYFWLRVFFFPIIFIMSAFFVSTVVNCIFSIILPAAWVKQNSKYYSHTSLRQDILENEQLPLITIQIPVYKESFHDVIKPTIENCLIACMNYEKRGGKINIFINDDGLLLLSESDKKIRIEYYNSISVIFYVARPALNRRGRFKKASNMNFCLRQIMVAQNIANSHMKKFASKYETLKYLAQKHKFMFGGGIGNDINIGDYILLLDSDSRITQDMLHKIVQEMELYPNIGFVQMLTNPLNITKNYWENCISLFTEHIYKIAFVYSCTNGHTAPLVGHNAILRWSAVKNASYVDEDINEIVYWSEKHVSEDFDMSLRMQCLQYSTRYIAYADGFEEGVSLTPNEEINRLKKYAYGVDEIIFHPVYEWTSKGILSPLVKKFMLCSHIQLHTKFSVITYIASYYALAAIPILTFIQYFLFRYSEYWRVSVIESLSIIISCLVVYAVLIPVSNIVVMYRMNYRQNMFKLIIHEIWYGFLLGIFFSGISFHLMEALLAHMFGINMQWSMTQKEVIKKSKFNEIINTISYLKKMYIYYSICIIIIIIFWFIPDTDIQNRDLLSVVPLLLTSICHLLMPFILNPAIMSCGIKSCFDKYNPTNV